MTRQSFSHLKPGVFYPKARATLAAGVLLALLSLTLLPASTARVEPPPAHTVTTPQAKTVHLPRTGIALAESRPATPAVMDALAGILARKYRVSEVATREFVLAAHREGSKSGVDPLLLLAVMAIESRFNPVARSDGGAMGLMQVIPRYHAEKFDRADDAAVLDPPTNIHVGARILRECIGRGGSEIAGLQLYNGAQGDVTSAYAARVLGEKQWLQETLRRAKERARA